MVQIDILGLGILTIFTTCILAFRYLFPSKMGLIEKGAAFRKLSRSLEMVMEGGTRLHFSLGRAGLLHNEGAASLAALAGLKEGLAAGTSGDSLPSVTCGEGTLALLGQATMDDRFGNRRGSPEAMDADNPLAGVTPATYAAGTLASVLDPATSGNVFLGHAGAEVALLAEAADRRGTLTLAGTDDLCGQALYSIWTGDVLYGEAYYSAPGLIRAATQAPAFSMDEQTASVPSVYQASLRTQDLFRWILVISVLAGILVRSLVR